MKGSSIILSLAFTMNTVALNPLPAIASGTQSIKPINAQNCRSRLDVTLAVMETIPVLKEELATGIMWMRLKAEQALDAGRVEECHVEISRVEGLLGL
jgi:hypothetical protein